MSTAGQTDFTKLGQKEIIKKDVNVFGMEHLSADDIRFATNQGLEIKLIPQVFTDGEHTSAYVLPQFVAGSEKRFHLDIQLNNGSMDARYKPGSDFNRADPGDVKLEVYLRYNNDELKKKLGFDFIREGLLHDSYKYAIGETTLAKLLQCVDDIRLDEAIVIATGKRSVKEKTTKIKEKIFT